MLVSDDWFFYAVLLLAIFQGVWYALSIQPTIFDEGRHVGFIMTYTHQLSPFITHQPPSLDVLGEVVRDPSYMYYYLMSWPLRIFDIFTHNQIVQIIFLRLINVAMFAAGIVLYRKVLIWVGISKGIVNISLLALLLTPIFAVLPGAVNYDNAIFPLSAALLLLSISISRAKRPSVAQIAGFISLGLFGSIVKFEFIAFFVPVLLYVAYVLWRNHHSGLGRVLFQSFKTMSRVGQTTTIAILLITSALFIERPVLNVIKYKALTPPCSELLSVSRCVKNYTEKRNIEALAEKPSTFTPANPVKYLLTIWLPTYISSPEYPFPSTPTLPAMVLLYYFGAVIGIVALLIYLRDFLLGPTSRLLICVMLGYTLILALYNYIDYVKYGLPVGINARYLLPILPIFIALVASAVAKLVRHNAVVSACAIILLLLIFTQGGGITTTLLVANKNFYWSGSFSKQFNMSLQKRLRNLIPVHESS